MQCHLLVIDDDETVIIIHHRGRIEAGSAPMKCRGALWVPVCRYLGFLNAEVRCAFALIG